MGFALQDAGLESYIDDTYKKPELYIKTEKSFTAPAMPLSKKKIEKQKIKIEKQILNN